jgi:hypothetical protein
VPPQANQTRRSLVLSLPIGASSTSQKSRSGNIGAAVTPKIVREWTLTFSLLFAHSFPVRPKSFPVNFDNEFRLKSAWMLHLLLMPSSF